MTSKEPDKALDGNSSMHLVVKNTFLEFTPKGFNDGRRMSAPTTFATVSNVRRGSASKVSVDGESLDTEACSSVLSSAETESVGVWADHPWSSSDENAKTTPTSRHRSSGLAVDKSDSAKLQGLPMTAVRTGDLDSMPVDPDQFFPNRGTRTNEAAFYQYGAPQECSQNENQYGHWQMGLGHPPMPTYPEMQSPLSVSTCAPSSYGMMQDWSGFHEPLSPPYHRHIREPLSPILSPTYHREGFSPIRRDRQAVSLPGSPKRNKAGWSNAKTPTDTQSNDEKTYTTVMLRNLPNDYTRDMLMELLDSQGFSGRFDFIYVPFDFKKHAGLGYAFMNMVTHQDAIHAMEALTGFHDWKLKSNKVMQVAWSTPLQGLWANVERYKNSPVMHPDVPNEFKPLLFANGVSVDFPPATKILQAPALMQ
mmetsp:Transcript_29340/g.45974  ORF Transcript_29340/g.45974 Transcript_29340/m.45974 type:complete len:421 (+) Transcript_29340:69-1331(+)